MKRLLILGGGTAGTMAANKLRKKLSADQWQITVVDQNDSHYYQPGYLFLPFGALKPSQVVKSRRKYLRSGVELVLGEVDGIAPDQSTVKLTDGRSLPYDYLIIATGTAPRPDQTEGMLEDGWQRNVFDFYTFDGARKLGEKLAAWDGGRLVLHITEMPIKCPVAPLEFVFLADAFFRKRGMRDRVELIYATPLEGAFTKPIASKHLGTMLDERKILVEPDFMVDRVDEQTNTLWSLDEREVPYDLLVTIPLNMGADFIGRSGMGNELNYVPVDKGNLLSKTYDNVFAIGDASDIPASKAGAVAHFSVDLLTENFVDHVHGRPMEHTFDGHANCFIESGNGKGLLIDFNYDTEPLPGKYPYPGVGPMSLLKETRMNHFGKLGFRWLYWNILMPGHAMPVPTLMSMSGKKPA